MRAIVLLGRFATGSGAGAWLGYAAAFASGLTSADPPRLPGGVLAASALAVGVLAALSVLARRAGGSGTTGHPARARAEGRGTRNSLLFAAAVFAVYAFGRVSTLALSPAALVALLLAFGAARRSALLRLAGITVGVLYALAGLAVSLARAF